MGKLHQQWLRISIINLLIVSFVGVILRYKIAFALSFIDQKHLLQNQTLNQHFQELIEKFSGPLVMNNTNLKVDLIQWNESSFYISGLLGADWKISK